MKKRVFSLLLALVLTLSAAAIPASAAGSFSDVSDKKTAQNVEILKLLGVIEGNGAGQFNPYAQLTRAEFSKMVVMLIGKGNEAMRYRTVTIFPDVRASHWAAGYINLAVRQTEPKLLAGTPDGTFQPERAITYGEAVTILMRVLGYADKDTGGVWPDSYIDLAKSAGVSNGVELAGNAAITRAQAAQLFVNVLYADTKDGKNYIDRGDKYTLVSVDGGTGELRLIDEKGVIVTKTLENPSSASVLIGLKGYLVERTNGKVRTFLPENGETVGTISNAAVIVSADRSTVGFSDLAGGRTDYNQVCVIGAEAAKIFFGTVDPVGKEVKINGNKFTVVGVYAPRGEEGENSINQMDNIFVIPYTMTRLLGGSVDQYTVKVRSSEDMTEVTSRLGGFLKGLIPQGTGGYDVYNEGQWQQYQNETMNTISMVLGGIAAISLLVGGIGIMNIMLVTVTERTREIGIRRAIGAQRASIVTQFLIEAGMLCGMGGVVGIAVGTAGSVVVSRLMYQMTVYPPVWVGLAAFALSVALGVLFGSYPAIKASKLQPVEALRAE